MELPEDIRIEIESSGERDTIMEVVSRLQANGVTITRDVIAAIVATMEKADGVVE